jgi:hypothetical protein
MAAQVIASGVWWRRRRCNYYDPRQVRVRKSWGIAVGKARLGRGAASRCTPGVLLLSFRGGEGIPLGRVLLAPVVSRDLCTGLRRAHDSLQSRHGTKPTSQSKSWYCGASRGVVDSFCGAVRMAKQVGSWFRLTLTWVVCDLANGCWSVFGRGVRAVLRQEAVSPRRHGFPAGDLANYGSWCDSCRTRVTAVYSAICCYGEAKLLPTLNWVVDKSKDDVQLPCCGDAKPSPQQVFTIKTVVRRRTEPSIFSAYFLHGVRLDKTKPIFAMVTCHMVSVSC